MNDMIQIYQWISIAGYIGAAVFLLAAVLLFFVLDIRSVLGYLSGRSRKKAVEEIQEQTESQKQHAPQEALHNERMPLTDQLVQEFPSSAAGETTLLPENPKQVLEKSAETVLLHTDAEGETGELHEEAASVIFTVEEEITFVHTSEKIDEY